MVYDPIIRTLAAADVRGYPEVPPRRPGGLASGCGVSPLCDIRHRRQHYLYAVLLFWLLWNSLDSCTLPMGGKTTST